MPTVDRYLKHFVQRNLLQVGDEGLETVDLTRWVDNNFGRCQFAGAAESGAVGADSPPLTAELTEVIEAWQMLPEAIRAVILAMVRAAEFVARRRG